MAVPRPKRYVAVKPFQVGGNRYDTGDVVSGMDLVNALRFGETFVVSEVAARRVEQADQPAPADTETPEG